MAPSPAGRPFPIGRRGFVALSLLAAGLWAFLALDLSLADLVPKEGGLKLAGEFLGRALSPAVEHETAFKPDKPLLQISLESAQKTSSSPARPWPSRWSWGIVLGFFASTAWWAGDRGGGRSPVRTWLSRTLFPAIYFVSRTLIAFMRSIHELLWALLMLIVFPTSPTTAIVAIAIPYGGTLAKIFSEMVDEAPRGPAHAMRAAGASGLQVFVFGLLPPAIPDMTAYAFYRFECALRSAAILGFFGFPTLGLRIKQAFQNGDFGETWTHLYALLALILFFDWWSGRLRRRMVG